ncbi:MAG: hypothetical protein OXI33_06670 [Chloroflexota bacterium]|nr:hypothetical protein [Chloroflexota bacterium]
MNINELKTLGFNSENDADAAEWALGIRFSDFTSEDRRTWRLQELCLKQYALTPDYERAARRAGVTVGEVEAWERHNVLGFVKRKEEAELRFSDTIQVVLLEMAKKPDSPPLLLSWLLHMHMPEKFDVLTPEDMADDPPGPTEAEILQQVAEQYNRMVRERERLLDEEELLVKSEIEDSVSAEILPSERVSYWPMDDPDRTRNN